MTSDRVLLQEAKVRYSQSYSFDTDRNHCREDWHFVPSVRRPWWYWLALVAYLGFMAGGFWIVWRAFMGWPGGVDNWLQRLVAG